MKLPVFSVVALICSAVIVPVSAHDGATGVVKQRMDVMKSIRNEMKPLRRMVRGRQDYNQEDFLSRVQSIKTVSGDIPALFPEGSLKFPSEALPAIWENWNDFTAQANSFHERVITLEQAVQSNNMSRIKTSFRSVAETCKACHDDYQED